MRLSDGGAARNSADKRGIRPEAESPEMASIIAAIIRDPIFPEQGPSKRAPRLAHPSKILHHHTLARAAV